VKANLLRFALLSAFVLTRSTGTSTGQRLVRVNRNFIFALYPGRESSPVARQANTGRVGVFVRAWTPRAFRPRRNKCSNAPARSRGVASFTTVGNSENDDTAESQNVLDLAVPPTIPFGRTQT
jgi:hypothetical protein